MRRNLLMTLLATAAGVAVSTQPVAAQGSVSGIGTTPVGEHATTLQPGVAVSSENTVDEAQPGPLASTWFAGAVVGRNFEREQFLLGAEAGLFFGSQAWGEIFAHIHLARTGVPNGTLWTVSPGFGVVPTALLLSPELMTRLIASLIYNRFSSDFGSGSDLGVAFSAGLLYGVNESLMLATDIGAQRAAGFTTLLLTFSLLIGAAAASS